MLRSLNPTSDPSPLPSPDDAIRSTDTDALLSRLSAIQLGYLVDPYAALLHRPSRAAPNPRRPPLINVGTHHRTWAVDRLVKSFLDSPGWKGKGKQVVSLGAGSDTRFWRLMETRTDISKYIEIDFPSITSPKSRRLLSTPRLLSPFPVKPTLSHGGTALTTPTYSLLPLDLRESPAQTLQEKLLPLLDPEAPTLWLAECLFCYMGTEESKGVMEWFSGRFARGGGVIYEMCGLDDAFGTVMKRNLLSRNIPLPGATFPSPLAQASRFLSAGYTDSSGLSLKDVRSSVIPKEELARISALEHLDEVEELELVLGHYCVAWGWKGEGVGMGL